LKLCIRDDDVSYYTQPEELEMAYSSLGDGAEYPITFSVVPFSVSDHTENYPYGKIENSKQYASVGDNYELVHYLKEKVNRGTGEIVLHQAKEILKYHLKHDFPLVFYVHYWHINREESVKKDLIRFTSEAIEFGAKPVLLSECFK